MIQSWCKIPSDMFHADVHMMDMFVQSNIHHTPVEYALIALAALNVVANTRTPYLSLDFDDPRSFQNRRQVINLISDRYQFPD